MTEDPIELFGQWYREAEQCKKIADASAVNLATASPSGAPSSRMVLLKGFDQDGFVIFTNLKSRKGKELEQTSQAALCFYWAPLARQVRIEGSVVPVNDEEADQYFGSRPLKSRIGAWASRQSEPLESRTTLLKQVVIQTARFAQGEVGRPAFWSGFRIVPDRMEYWTNGEYRLHDRILYTRDMDGRWQHGLLYP
ncbi:pyridoxamine 5'-phosphate oxidase [Parasphingorhabdus sp.]|uniref:pyridoxamine 5'-phosphate oxidase n=1 Tax=Parasphingorhabdus sp. TaxID=2709688 RepID=UPI002B27BC7F|nr:pyridoxamine 5'-phosphate oxidase [Parasphingorhabdus sp.]